MISFFFNDGGDFAGLAHAFEMFGQILSLNIHGAFDAVRVFGPEYFFYMRHGHVIIDVFLNVVAGQTNKQQRSHKDPNKNQMRVLTDMSSSSFGKDTLVRKW